MGGFIGLNPKIVNWKPVNTPQGVMTGSIRPLTNKDYTNTTIYKHGSTRPNKTVYRTGYNVANTGFVNSSVNSTGIHQTIDAPGLSSTISNNPYTDTDIKQGIPLCVSDALPNYNLTNNPEAFSCSPTFCCNNEKKARRSSYAANTVKRNNYYTNNAQYLYQRDKTYSQNSFHFLKSNDYHYIDDNSSATSSQKIIGSKPGGPISTMDNYNYHTNSHCTVSEQNGKSCKKNVIYNPNNYKFANQGAVTDRTHNLSLILSTLSKASRQRVSQTF